MRSLVIIPAYNEAKNIENVVKKLLESTSDVSYIIVNDCSTDNTEELCEQKGFEYITLPVNLGIGGGVQAGYKYALENDYDIAIQMDGDGQHDALELHKLINKIKMDEADIVIGSRFIEGKGFQSSLLRRIGINFLSNLIKICCGVRVKDVTSGFRAVNKRFIKIYADEYSQDYPEPEAIVAGALLDARIAEVPVIMHERKEGISSINSWKPVYYMIKESVAILIYRLTFNKRRFESI